MVALQSARVPAQRARQKKWPGLSTVLIIVMAAIAAAIVVPHAAARADTITRFRLDNIVFTDFSYATGTFVFDKDKQTVDAWSINYQSGFGGTVPSFTFDSGIAGNTAGYNSLEYGVFFYGPALNQALYLALREPLGSTRNSVVTSGCPCRGTQTFVGNFFGNHVLLLADNPFSAVDPIPEPATLPVLAVALGLLTLLRQTHVGRQQNQAVAPPLPGSGRR